MPLKTQLLGQVVDEARRLRKDNSIVSMLLCGQATYAELIEELLPFLVGQDETPTTFFGMTIVLVYEAPPDYLAFGRTP